MLQKVLAANGDRAVYPSLIGKKVLITGGASGIGAALVEAFVKQGCETAFIDKEDALGEALVERLSRETGFTPSYGHCDLTDLDAVAGSFAEIVARLGGVDILVNNAANDDRHGVADVTPAYWDERMAVNLRHLFFAAQAVIPGMRARGGGSIVNFGSISWHLGLTDLVLYQTAKAAIEGLTRSLARELGRDNIRVNAIIPGNVETPRQERWHTPEDVQAIIAAQSLKVRVQPRDVAAMALFLASDDSRMCTGHNYWVDAGWR
jgi:NAD(P)-dependent dehydrogenase (short-subunit alcohol dehydrogenase family)